ncbi:MAG TPA: lipopolysaccharide biosynthesis protein [Frateuria sp.]|uniref:lipopolysaccharide biosynthesis protein n=1 Tax=Frateuria sp. TaxID=2211372 RepID=UPI002DEB790E|nr:lipopolysaccharide biosynthesis protein [Frateuria sp.]
MSAATLYAAIAKSMLGRAGVYAASLLSMVVLARIFTPRDFGTVASIAVFSTFFQLMTEAGLGPAIINLKTLTPRDRNGLFGLTVLTGAVLAMVFEAARPLWQAFYGMPRVGEVVPYVSASLLFYSAAIVPTAFLLRDQAFYRIANAGIVSELVSTGLSLVLLRLVDPLHALAAKSAFSAATNFLMTYLFSGRTQFGRPQWGTRFSAIRPLLSFSGYQFGFNVLNYFSRNLDNILVGRYLGTASLGVYDKAYRLMRYPLVLITFAMTPAIQPVVQQYAHDKARVEAIHREFIWKLSLLGAAAGLLIFLLAGEIVAWLLGPQWTAVVPVVRILAIAIPVQVVLSTSGSFFQALDRTDLLFAAGVASSVVMVSAIVWGVLQRDLSKLSWALVVAFHINFFLAYYIMYSRIFGKGLRAFLAKLAPAAVVVMGMVAFHHSFSATAASAVPPAAPALDSRARRVAGTPPRLPPCHVLRNGGSPQGDGESSHDGSNLHDCIDG